MSDNVDSSVDSVDDSVDTPKKKRGQSKRTEEELRALFEASGIDGLLEVEMSEKGNARCTVRRLEGKKLQTIFGPCAGNSLARAIDGCVKMGPYLSTD